MPDRILFRRDIAANWSLANPVLAAGEAGFETNTDLLKIGNGTANWTSLPYVNPVLNSEVGGRLSVLQNVAAPINDGADTPATTILYYVPYISNKIALYMYSKNSNPTVPAAPGWRIFTFDYNTSIPLTGLPANTNYDVFAYPLDGAVRLGLTQWSGDFTRAVNLVSVDGVLVKNGDATWRYLGTIRTSAVGRTEFTRYRKFVFNYYNRVMVSSVNYNWTSHTYSGGLWRPFDNFNNWESQTLIPAPNPYAGKISFVAGCPLAYSLAVKCDLRFASLALMGYFDSYMVMTPAQATTWGWDPATISSGLINGLSLNPFLSNPNADIIYPMSTAFLTTPYNVSGLVQFWLAEQGSAPQSYAGYCYLSAAVLM